MARKSRFNIVEENIEIQSYQCRCGLYVRLSDDDGDDEEFNSIGNQKKIGLKYLSEHLDIQLVDIYVDNGYTGMNYNRPDFQRMYDDLKSGRINCVIVKDISRFGRHFIMTSEFVERTLPEMGVRLICINDDYDSADELSDAIALTLPLKMVMNDYYAKNVSKNIRSTIHAKMNSGEFLPPAGSIPYGYLRNPELNTFDVDEEAAPIVVMIYELRLKNMSYSAVAKKLNEDEIPSPGKLRFVRGVTVNEKYKDVLWNRKAVQKILSDPVYLGIRIHGKVKRDKLGMPKTRRPKEEWQYIYNAHPAIISQEVYDSVQKIAEEDGERRANFKEGRKIGNDYRELFRKKVFCKDCGAIMRATKRCARKVGKADSWIAYYCGAYLESSGLRCSNHYVNQEDIMLHVKNVLNQQVKLAVDMERLIADIEKMPHVRTHQSIMKSNLSNIASQRKRLEDKIEKLLFDLADQLITSEEFTFMKKRYSAELKEVEAKEAEAKEEAVKLGTVLSSAKQWANTLKEYHKLPEINREIVEILIDKILVSEDQSITVVLNFADPFKLLKDYLQEIEVIQDAV